jgi:hypothetical protein
MGKKLKTIVSALALATVVVGFGSSRLEAASRPTVVSCGAGTHAVVRHPIVNGYRVRRVTCVRNSVYDRRVIGTTGRTVARCGPGTHAVVHHPTVNGHRVRRVVCVR